MGRPPLSRDVQVSKKLSWLLRHGIQQEKLQMNSAGYVNVAEVLNNRNLRSLKVTFEELQGLVATNDKQRFSLIPGPTAEIKNIDGAADASTNSPDPGQRDLNPSSNPKDYLIRANQGHSVDVDSESLLTKIDASDIPSICVHGTTHHAWTLIVQSGGLKRMTRQHVHFATGLPKGYKSIAEPDVPLPELTEANAPAAPVISGMRNSSTVLVFLDMAKALEGGLVFWKSANDVLLTSGNEDGLVPLTYFRRVEDRTGGQGIMVQDGQLLKEPPAAWASKGSGHRGGRSGGNRGGKAPAA